MTVLEEAYAGVTALLAGLSEEGLAAPSHCDGWRVRDVLVHLVLDPQRALVACATPTDDPASVDAVTYWAAEGGGPDDGAHAAFVRGWADALSTAGLRRLWADTAAAAARAVAALPAQARVRTQGHVLTVGDLADTLVVEAVVHHLDAVAGGGPLPAPGPLRAARSRLEAMAGAPVDYADADADADVVLALAGRPVPALPGVRPVLGRAAAGTAAAPRRPPSRR